MEVSGQLYLQGKSPWHPLGWVGPRAILNAVVKRKVPSPRRVWNPRNLIVEPAD